MFRDRTKSATPQNLSSSLQGNLAENTSSALSLVAINQADLLRYRGDSEGGIVAAGRQSGVALGAADGGLLMFDKHGVRLVPLSGLVDIQAYDDQLQRRTIYVGFDMSSTWQSKRQELGGFTVEFETEDGFHQAAEALRIWWGMMRPNT